MVDSPFLFLAPAAAAGWLGWTARQAVRDLRVREAPTPEPSPEGPTKLAAVVLNPSKFPDAEVPKALIRAECHTHGWPDPLIIETTVDDAGTGMARQALADGADVVFACGGDGTVRTVAEVLANSGTPMAVLPAGTGNLLARNLNLPLDDLPTCVRIGLTGRDHPIDVGWFAVDNEDEQAFLVMAGVGFDAEIMIDAPELLKARVGPAAYVVSGMRNLNGPRRKVRVELDDREPLSRRVRSVIIGNCGKLHANIELMPDAAIDDGVLDTLVLSPRGVVGWAAVAGEVITRHHRGHRLLERFQSERVEVTAAEPLSAQVDGDPIGEARRVTARVDPGALIIRLPSQDG